MSRVRVHNFSVSVDGFATGEGQSPDAPFGHAGDTAPRMVLPDQDLPADAGQAGREHRGR